MDVDTIDPAEISETPWQRYLVTWRKPAPDFLDHDYYICEDLREVDKLIKNIKEQGVHQYNTFILGGRLVSKSSTY